MKIHVKERTGIAKFNYLLDYESDFVLSVGDYISFGFNFYKIEKRVYHTSTQGVDLIVVIVE